MATIDTHMKFISLVKQPAILKGTHLALQNAA